MMRIEPERRCEKTVEKGDRKKGDGKKVTVHYLLMIHRCNSLAGFD